MESRLFSPLFFVLGTCLLLPQISLAAPELSPRLECQQFQNYQSDFYSQVVLAGASPLAEKFDQLMVSKSERTLLAFNQGRVNQMYAISVGQNPIGAKTEEGDNKTPEGLYSIIGKNPGSAYHLALQISYPNAQDVQRAKKRGKEPGHSIMVHGFPKDPREKNLAEALHTTTQNWTQGCIALTNSEIEEIYPRVEVSTPILICP